MVKLELIRNQKQRKIEQDKYLDELLKRISGEKKAINYERINELSDNKKRTKTFEKERKKIEQEEGLTFRPAITKDKYSKRI